MNEKHISVIIPFRDRGTDPRRAANLEVVQAWWYAHGYEPQIVDDGLEGDASFNRHRAYNRAVSGNPETEVFIFTEADMLIHPDQIDMGIRLATRNRVQVVPFSRYLYLSENSTTRVRDAYHDLRPDAVAKWWGRSWSDPFSVFSIEPESTMENGRSTGAVNIVSRETLDITGGFTEATSGNWYDDRIIEEGWAYLTGNKPTFVPGPALHLYHLPGWKGDHLTPEDIIATDHNKYLLRLVREAIHRQDPEYIREIMETRA